MGVRDLLASLPVGKLRVSLASSTVATGAYTEITSSLAFSCSAVTIAYTGGGILYLAKGAAASEVDLPLHITPGMQPNMLIPLELSKGFRLSVKAVDVAVAEGELVINFYG